MAVLAVIHNFSRTFAALMKNNITAILYITTVTLLSLCVATHGKEYNSRPCSMEVAKEVITTDTIRLMFGGDLMQHLPQITAAQQSNGSHDYTTSFEHIAPLFRDADIAVLNFETTINTSGKYSGYPLFAAPPAVADAMVDMGIDIALLANNHCCDRSGKGIDSTIEEFRRRSIAHVGVYKDSVDYHENNIRYFKCKGVNFALLNYTYSTNGMPIPKGRIVNLIDTVTIKRDLHSIEHDSVDCIIACMHWGIEYQRKANREQKAIAEMMRREGVDIIIGSHPHVVQPYYADSTFVVYYSLGNLVSNQRWRYSDGGLLAEVEVIRCDTIEGLRYKTTPHPVWVMLPGYRVLPRSVGDTLNMPTSSRGQYNQFISDTETLLGQQ